MGLLALLAEGPAHGYGLKAAFESRTGSVWTVNVGQVYTTLDRLHAEGLVQPVDHGDGAGDAAESGRDRRVWTITPAGKGELEDWFDAAHADTAPPRDELLVKVLLAFGRSPNEALAVVDRQRTELYRAAQAHRRSRGGSGQAVGDDLDQMAAELMAEAIAARQEADLRWLDQCETSILERTKKGRTS